MGIIVLFFLLCVIGLVCHIARHDYKPEPIRYVEPSENYRKSSFWCPIHKNYFGCMGAICPMCENDYNNDVIAGIYPPGIDESNQQFYYVEDWIALRKIDLHWRNGEISEAEAIRRRDKYIMDTIPKRIAVATGIDPEIQKARIEANQKRLQNYAGAAQYSGITPK